MKETIVSRNQGRAYHSPFRYAVVVNEVEGKVGRGSSYRYVEVLLEDKAFSEETLKELFDLLTKRFRKPLVLHVKVFTSLDDVQTPEERESPRISEVDQLPPANKNRTAFFLRDANKNEWFRYENLNGAEKTVIIKGKAPK